jgi:hypothetical protein
VLAGGSGSFKLSGGLPVAEHPDEPACLGAVEHDGRGLAVPEGPSPTSAGCPAALTCGRCWWA